jgi:heat shock protein HtpX
MGPDTPAPVLVYDRIDANRRSTRLLLGAYVLALLPFVAVITFALVFLLDRFMPQPPVGSLLAKKVITFAYQTIRRGWGEDVAVLWLVPIAVLVIVVAYLVAYGVLPTAGIVAIQYWLASRMVLRQAGGRPLAAGEEPELRRSVESLCIGAGLPAPHLYLIDSPAPNALATGRDPAHASLAFTRGLLALLDRSELDAVVAHELSHIGNQDTRLGTLLAAAVRTLRLPWTMAAFEMSPLGFVVALFRDEPLSRRHWKRTANLIWPLLLLFPWPFGKGGGVLHWLVFLTGLYVLALAPVVGHLLRSAVSRQREFLADADAALLTRDPEGLALALAKIEAAGQAPLRGQASVSHLYIVDPVSSDSPWLDRLFSMHPSIQKRIELLARMGTGIPPERLERARASVMAQRAAGLLELGASSRGEDVPPAEPATAPDGFGIIARELGRLVGALMRPSGRTRDRRDGGQQPASVTRRERVEAAERDRQARELTQVRQLAEEADARPAAEAQRAQEAEARQAAEAQRAREAETRPRTRRRAKRVALAAMALLFVIIAAIFYAAGGIVRLTRPLVQRDLAQEMARGRDGKPGWARILAPQGRTFPFEFLMGCVPDDEGCSDDEKDQHGKRERHPVTLSRPFELMTHEVTVAQYRRFSVGTEAPVNRWLRAETQGGWSDDRHPVVNVSWYEAAAFCAFVGGRLPTEAEWEWAARGGHADWIYPWGNNAADSWDYANSFGRGGRDEWEWTAPVGSLRPNGFGLHDMAGNVWEWTSTLWRDYPYKSDDGREDPEEQGARVVRGGSAALNPVVHLRVSFRTYLAPTGHFYDLGLRCARDISP